MSNNVSDNNNNNIFTLYLATFSTDAYSLDSLLFGLVCTVNVKLTNTHTHTGSGGNATEGV